MPLPFAIHLTQDWSPPGDFFQGCALSPGLIAAMGCEGSLTRHLQGIPPHRVSLRLLSHAVLPQEADPPGLWEGVQRLPQEGPLLHRDAWLEIDGQPWVFAHSQLTLEGLPERMREEIQRGNQPLGALFLEHEESLERHDLQMTWITAPWLARQVALPEEHPLPARRSLLRAGRTVRARILEIFVISL